MRSRDDGSHMQKFTLKVGTHLTNIVRIIVLRDIICIIALDITLIKARIINEAGLSIEVANNSSKSPQRHSFLRVILMSH